MRLLETFLSVKLRMMPYFFILYSYRKLLTGSQDHYFFKSVLNCYVTQLRWRKGEGWKNSCYVDTNPGFLGNNEKLITNGNL